MEGHRVTETGRRREASLNTDKPELIIFDRIIAAVRQQDDTSDFDLFNLVILIKGLRFFFRLEEKPFPIN